MAAIARNHLRLVSDPVFRFVAFDAERPAQPVSVEARSFADAAAAFLEVGNASVLDGQVDVVVVETGSGERQAFTLDVA